METIKTFESEVARLKFEMEVMKNFYEFSINKADKQILDLKASIKRDLEEKLQIELQGLYEFAFNLPENDREILVMYINNMKQCLN
jgi:hypothetical protein